MANAMTHEEFSRRGGLSRSPLKTSATRKNAEAARKALQAAREEKKQYLKALYKKL